MNNFKNKGKMVEWFNTSVLKTDKVNSFQGSNPCLSKKIYISILSIKKINIKFNLIKILLSQIQNFHFDLMEFSYVKNNSFSISSIKSIIFFLKKILNINYEFHIMSKFFLKKIFKNSIFHIENLFSKYNNIALSPNFCWNYTNYLNFKQLLIMSVLPGFGNQKFLIKTIKKNIINSIDGGINIYIYKKIYNYFNKIIIGSNILNKKNLISYYEINFIINEFLI